MENRYFGAKPGNPMTDHTAGDRDGERLERERLHALKILDTNESNWGWHTPAGRIRWQRRLDFLTSTNVVRPAAVLEIGAGTGTFTQGLSEAFANLTSIDISPDLLNAAKRKAPQVQLFCMDAHELNFPPETFDVVVGCSVLHHLDWTRAIEGFFRVLRPGGEIRFSEPNLWNPQIFLQKNIPLLKRFAGDSPDEYAFTSRAIRADLQSAGFVDVQVRPYEFLHPSVPKSLINFVTRLEAAFMRTPVRHIGGSLLISAEKPA